MKKIKEILEISCPYIIATAIVISIAFLAALLKSMIATAELPLWLKFLLMG